MPRQVVIVPIAFDLARDPDQRVTMGPGTKAACDAAAVVAEARWVQGERPFFLSTAGRAPAEWDHVRMGLLMADYLCHKKPGFCSEFHEAKLFTTLGEVLAVAEWLKSTQADFHVVFVVKEWHAPRLRMIARKVFAWKKAGTFDIHVHYYPATLGNYVHELLGWVKNWWLVGRMIRADARRIA